MKPLRVVNIQRGCVYDGPGIRTTLFLKGCTMHCPWCCNPESISYEREFYVDNDKCLKENNVESEICIDCYRNGGARGLELCPMGVQTEVSTDMNSEEVISELLKDILLYKRSNGGITISGGEPLLYSEELLDILQHLYSKKISVFIETTLSVSKEKWEFIIPYIDGFIVDLKLQSEIGVVNQPFYNESISRALNLIHDKVKIFRIVFVNSIAESIDMIVDFLNRFSIKELEILKCHNLAESKYKRLGKSFIPFHVDSQKLSFFCQVLKENNINYSVLSV